MLRASGASYGCRIRQAFALRESRPGAGVEDVAAPFQLLKTAHAALFFTEVSSSKREKA
jgi:hypothetical protein